MRIVSFLAVAALAAGPALGRSQDRPGASGAAAPSPAPKADAGPAAPPRAQPAPKAGAAPKDGTATRPPAAAADLARALLTNEQWSKVLDSYASSLAGQISQALMSKGEKVPEDLRGKLRDELGKTLPYQDTVQAQAQALAKELTPDELRKTATFYGSPVGRKVLDKLPEAQSQVAQQLQSRLATAVPEIVNRLAPTAMTPPKGGAPGGSPGTGTGTGSSGGAAGESGSPVEGHAPPGPAGSSAK